LRRLTISAPLSPGGKQAFTKEAHYGWETGAADRELIIGERSAA
jgi:hypothetical protein